MGKRKQITSSKSSKKVKKEEEEVDPIIKEEEVLKVEEPEDNKPEASTGHEASPKQNKQKNKKKMFWPVSMKSLQFNSDHSETDIKKLLEMVDKHGEEFIQHCCLGLFVQEKGGKHSLILNKRYKNVIATFGDVEKVSLLEIIFLPNLASVQVETIECKPHTKKTCFSSMNGLSKVHTYPSKLAWKINYGDGSFDLHVMVEAATKTIQNNSKGAYFDFSEYFNTSLTFFDASELEDTGRPRKISAGLLESRTPTTQSTTPPSPQTEKNPPTYSLLDTCGIIEKLCFKDQLFVFTFLAHSLQITPHPTQCPIQYPTQPEPHPTEQQSDIDSLFCEEEPTTACESHFIDPSLVDSLLKSNYNLN
ncbi:hypothetical protein NAEGRDRAFT_58294 [Naegleria gruberi]|uniref:Uncharacterized protein n=1 Tax=Naegleria gruberi TaxID=5762 RepID=D2VI86_NAEGR|nr:uncharacterized protein NAEGRDRAFT_58294 [Naegleria gruberi]EFC43466.1 hypothetical protein NAEGRDRAFT_58294 [Naegleria gruberi]|eukprot:XP_002676210.1 hypothetical protein NAEGRDRAFT_58294 [Naegleria gruberi strain NEG-M]